MKVIIAGSRNYHDYTKLSVVLDHELTDEDEIVSGCAKGVDTMAINYAMIHRIPLHKYPAEWVKHGRNAGPIRNREMALFANRLIAFYNGESPGTKNMIQTMLKLGKPVTIIDINE